MSTTPDPIALPELPEPILCTCPPNAGCTKPCDRNVVSVVPLNEELRIEAAILSDESTHHRRLKAILNRAADALAPAPQVPEGMVLGVDVESMLKACVPGGDLVDPQLAADNIRSWFATTPQDAARVEAKAAWWEVRRESDPSFPRVFKTESEADTLIAFVTVNPGPTKHPLYTTPPPGVDVGKLRELRELAPRASELAERLVASGPKAAHVSASECHEITEFVRDTIALIGDGGESAA